MKRILATIFIMFITSESIHAGDTPLHIAARAGLTQEVKNLLSRGENPFVANEKGLLPVQNAANNDILCLLVAAMNEYSGKIKQKE